MAMAARSLTAMGLPVGKCDLGSISETLEPATPASLLSSALHRSPSPAPRNLLEKLRRVRVRTTGLGGGAFTMALEVI